MSKALTAVAVEKLKPKPIRYEIASAACWWPCFRPLWLICLFN